MNPVTAFDAVGSSLATRADLLGVGVSGSALAAAVRSGEVLRPHRGVYLRGIPGGFGAVVAAAVAIRGTVSHDSAAAWHRIEFAHDADAHVTVPRNRTGAKCVNVTLHRVDLSDTERVAIAGGRCHVTTPLRTGLDCARSLPLRFAVVVADSAVRRGLVTREELLAAAAQLSGPGARKIRRVAALTDERCGSVLESLLRVLLVENGLVPLDTQRVVCDREGHFVAVVDFYFDGLVVEADGFEFHSDRSVVRKDRRKMNAFTALDLRVLRFGWEDVLSHERYVVDAVRAELQKPPIGACGCRTSTQTVAPRRSAAAA